MKLFFLILIILIGSTTYSQAYVKVIDKPEYEKYLSYCNTPISRPVTLTGKLTVLQVNGLYADAAGNYVAKMPITIVWTPIGSKPTPCETYQRFVYLKFEVMVKRRTPSIPDFYKYWKKNFIQEGLLDERSGAY